MVLNVSEIEQILDTCPEELSALLDFINFKGSIDSEKRTIVEAIDSFVLSKLGTSTFSEGFSTMLSNIVETKHLTLDEMIYKIVENEDAVFKNF